MSTRFTTSPLQILALFLSGLMYGALAYATPRTQFWQLLALLAGAFGLYVYLLKSHLSLRVGLVAAFLLRMLWLPVLPNLSDDYHRFRWDGLLVAQGVNPFQYRPDELVSGAVKASVNPSDTTITQLSTFNHTLPATVNQQLTTLYPKLNSPHYYSVYPPVCQAAFGLASGLFPTNELGAVIILRLVVLLAEAGTAALLVALLSAFGQTRQRALWYLLNPLVVAELTGNLHFEALMICFALLALWLLVQGKRSRSAVALGLAVGTKLLPVLVLPLLIKRLGWRQFLRYSIMMGAVIAVLFLPFFSLDLLHNINRSLTLYFSKFEFNASVYYVLRSIGYRLTGYNEIAIIGPGLARATAVLALWLAWREKPASWATLPRTLLFTLTIYYLFAIVVHPWYLAPLVALSVFTTYRFALVWSGMVVLSYAAYQTSAYLENSWLLGLEYLTVLAVLAWELRRNTVST
ncbi:glycosyltransferase 87 family protein [Hymenobacter volaticus]|uniref:DUF2029 domain-containing protein n=1 Tax=Hymenobacter volaticus TaxID=2932254 RepID=A0ABY4GBE9_9BACT|nr:glycosyltransferase 87 family protein [Hymenobacter volaticus]UOQ68092.1 hypothetical protein MUN86_09710 [Hymenobacter volaticus]